MTVYPQLMATPGGGDPFDRHVFACVLAIAAAEAPRPLTEAVGLDGAELAALLARHFPGGEALLPGAAADAGAGAEAVEEADYRRLLLDGATVPGSDEARWLAAMVARRSLCPDHLWQGLGLPARADLSQLLHRHFGPLAARNVRDMKWKKFFYRQMCEAEGMSICKSPVCDDCVDFDICFGGEE
jgi:nitrogen fixation protein NifQ